MNHADLSSSFENVEGQCEIYFSECDVLLLHVYVVLTRVFFILITLNPCFARVFAQL
jgi:hypothetical protein